MIVVHTTIPLDPDRRADAMEYVEALIGRSQTEAGTVRYRAMIDLDDPNTLRFFEQYEDEAALDAHSDSDEYDAFVRALPDLVDGPLETVQFEADDVQAVEFDAEEAIPEE